VRLVSYVEGPRADLPRFVPMPSPAPPSDRATLQSAAAWLDAQPPDVRATWCEEARARIGEGPSWTRLLLQVFSQADPPRARALMQEARALGLTREDARAVVGELTGCTTVQEAWALWTAEEDREELRLRMELLYHAPQVSEALAPFLMFFFRSSVVALYRSAALTIGRHLHATPALLDAVKQFAATRGVVLNAPIELNGHRARRRLLLVLTAAARREGGTPEALQADGLSPDPLPWNTDASGERTLPLPPRASDAAALLVACELVAGTSPTPEEVAALDAMLRTVVANAEATWMDRAVLQRFGRLLVQRASMGPPLEEGLPATLMTGLISSRWQQLHAQSGDRIEGRLQSLLQLDETLRTLALLPAEVQAAVRSGWRETLPEGAREWMLHRLAVWFWRDDSDASATTATTVLPAAPPEDGPRLASGDTPEAIRQRVAHRYAEEAAPDAFLPDPAQPQARLLADLLRQLEDTATWYRRSPATRALLIFHLLDEAEHLALSAAQVGALLPEEEAVTYAGRAAADMLRTHVLLQVVALEPPGVEAFVDALLLYQVADARVLAALLPRERRSPLLPLLADAVEHFVRWQLRQTPDFSAAAFLYGLTARRPHRTFFQELQAVCADRTYKRADDTAVPLQAVVAWVAGEGPPVADDPLVRLVEDVRAALRAVAEAHVPLPARLALLAEVLSGEGPQHRGRTLKELLATLHLGASDGKGDTVATLAATLLPQAEQIRPTTIQDVDEAKQALAQLATVIARVRTEILPAIPAAEAQLVTTILARVEEEHQGWAAGLDALPGVQERGTVREALAPLQEVSEVGLRPDLLRLTWQALQTDAPSDNRYEALIREAARHPVSAGAWDAEARLGWLEAVARTWQERLQEAIRRQEEATVAMLLTDDAYKRLRQQPVVQQTLQDARAWCLDRFLLVPAHAAHTDLCLARQENPPSHLRELLSLGQRFSKVWLSLVVGVILMLDFGDPFVAMAEIGDVQGMVLTVAIGIGGALLYIVSDLRRKSQAAPGQSSGRYRRSLWARSTAFFAACLVYTLLVTSFMWFLLSGTDEVVHGTGAIGHIVVWAGFALFVGVFFGLVLEQD